MGSGFYRGLVAAVVAIGMAELSAPSVGAVIFYEPGDAGDLIHNAAVVPAGTTKIVGSLGSSFEVDLYRLTIPQQSRVSFQVVPTGEWFDDDMFLFDAVGHPIAVSDFAWSIDLNAGTYHFGLTDWNAAATDGAGNYIADDYYTVLNTSAVLGGWAFSSSPYSFGPYEINMTVQPIPEPAAATVLIASVGAVALRRRSQPVKPAPSARSTARR